MVDKTKDPETWIRRRKGETTMEEQQKARLPKLKISKFDDAVTEWTQNR